MQRAVVKMFCRWAAAIGYAVLVISCSKEKPVLKQEGPISFDTYVATIDGVPSIKLGEVFTQMDQLAIPGSNKEPTPENAFDEVLYLKLASLRTATYTDFDPVEIHRLAKNRMHDALMQYMYGQLVSGKAQIPDSSIDSAYRANLAALSVPERRSVTHILMSANPKAWEAAGENVTGLSDKDLLAKAKTEIFKLHEQIVNGADIAELAAKYSHDTNSKARRGDSGWFTREEMVDPFSNQAFSLPIGKISKPFSSEYGWHILRVDSIAKGTVQPLDSTLREQIRGHLVANVEARIGQAFVDSVFNLAEFEWNETLLQQDPNAYDPYDWVCIVNHTDTINAVVLHENELMYRTRMRTSNVTVEQRKSMVLSRATPWVLSSVARKMGIADSDTMKAIYEGFRKAEIMNRIVRDRIPLNMEWTDEQLESYYNSHVGDFKSDKPVKVQHIVFEDSLKALQALAEIPAGADFRETALKYYPGDQDFKEAAFDLGWIGRDDISPEFYDRAWLTPTGQVSGPQRTQWGFHLIKVLDRKSQLDFQSSKAEVRRLLRTEAYKEQDKKWIASLKKGHDIVRLDDIWSQVDFKKPLFYSAVADSIKRAKAAGAGSGQ